MMEETGELTWRDHAVAGALGIAIAALAWFTGNSAEVPPDLWGEISVALGIRPPPTIFPSLWRNVASLLFMLFGQTGGLFLLRVLGPISLGLTAVLTFRMFDELLPATLRFRMRRMGWSRRIVRFVLLQGAVFFVCSDPVWRAGKILSPTMLLLLMTLASVHLFLHGLRTSNRRDAVAMSAVFGVLAAESPIGFLPMAAFPLVVIVRLGPSREGNDVPLSNPLVRLVTFRRMTLAFFGGWLATMIPTTLFFRWHDGLIAHDWNSFTYYIHYLHRYVQLIQSAATPVGWVFIGGLVVFPVVMSTVLARQATDDDKFLVYLHGVYFVAAGLITFLQSAGWSPFWFWTWARAEHCVKSEYLLCLCLLATSLTAMMSLCVVGVEIYFRNNRRIAQVRFQDAVEVEPAAQRMVQHFRVIDHVLRAVLLYEPLFAAALILPFKFSQTERRMSAIINEGARLTAEECGDSRLLFTDGALDAAVEVAAESFSDRVARPTRPLKAVSMMSSSDPRDIYLRTRWETDPEDRGMLETGAADALRTWVRSKPECATNIALQLGFELWRHDKLPIPQCGGFVARTAGFPPGVAEAGRKAALDLADRILKLYENADPMGVRNRGLVSMFMFLQWRIARMCRMRADAADKAGNTALAMEESEVADSLDAKNAAYSRIRKAMDWVGQQKGMRLTPREGLRIGLERADFRLARTFAQQVLLSDPENTRANFAMGMGYFIEEQYGRAEIYLKKCLAKNPDEPAALNNLAIAQLRMGRLDEAETNAAHALRVHPTSIEVQKTFQHILNTRQKKYGIIQP
jgi:tetratricopeptide (TPR) repeat protein